MAIHTPHHKSVRARCLLAGSVLAIPRPPGVFRTSSAHMHMLAQPTWQHKRRMAVLCSTAHQWKCMSVRQQTRNNEPKRCPTCKLSPCEAEHTLTSQPHTPCARYKTATTTQPPRFAKAKSRSSPVIYHQPAPYRSPPQSATARVQQNKTSTIQKCYPNQRLSEPNQKNQKCCVLN